MPRSRRSWLCVALFAALCLGHAACAATQKRNVAILVWKGAELLDFAGPAEVFSAAGRHRFFNVYMVGLDRAAVKTQGGVIVQPEFDLTDAPKPDIIVIPGGNMRPVEGNRHVLDWLRERAPTAEIVLSVCTGAFLLAETGFLDGLEATTHHFAFDSFEREFPRVKVVRTERFVDNGKYITAGGVSAGIDGALHVVQKLHGREAAHWTATEWMEYKRNN